MLESERNDGSNSEDVPTAKRRKELRKEEADAFFSGDPKPEAQSDNSDVQSGEPRKKRKAVALLMSYNGSGYYGMQVTRNEKFPAVEDVFGRCLVAAGAITQQDYENFGKIHFQRGCRTDKNVSAARQVISLKMMQIENPVEEINKHVPQGMIVHSVKRTTRGFDSKKWASSRVYSYVMPTFCLDPSLVSLDRFEEDACERCRTFRVSEQLLDAMDEALSNYIGTKNFHNFTAGKEFRDASAFRYNMSFKVSRPPYMFRDVEFVTVSVHGQSFMLHQIRKMIGLAVAVVRGNIDSSIYEKVFHKAAKYDIPKFPSVGLFLDEVFFEHYNKKFGSDHEKLEWPELFDQIENWKKTNIVDKILETILEEKVFENYLPVLAIHSYSDDISHRPERRRQQLLKQVEETQQADLTSSASGADRTLDTVGQESDELVTEEPNVDNTLVPSQI